MTPDPNDEHGLDAAVKAEIERTNPSAGGSAGDPTMVDPEAVTDPVLDPFPGREVRRAINEVSEGLRMPDPAVHEGGSPPVGQQVPPDAIEYRGQVTGQREGASLLPESTMQVRRIGWGVLCGANRLAEGQNLADICRSAAQLAQAQANNLGVRVTLEVFNSRGELTRARFFNPIREEAPLSE